MESVTEVTPFFFFFTLCITVSGGDENCDYSWDVIFNAEDWASLHMLYNVGGTPDTTNGFRVLSEKRIFVWADSVVVNTISHESRHVLCDLEQPGSITCHGDVHSRYKLVESSERDTPKPPQYSAKFNDSLYGRVN